jgi:hypothetical protein
VITIPEHCWSLMLHEFAREIREVEQVCYLDGVMTSQGDGVVTSITFPNAQLFPGRFEVSPDAMSEAGKHFRAFNLRRLAQVHTHPSDWTGHSPWDDAKAYSQLAGAISIVLPNFARARPSISKAGIHVRMKSGWRALSQEEAARQVRTVPSTLDFRLHRRDKNEQARIKPSRRRSWWQALHFWRS